MKKRIKMIYNVWLHCLQKGLLQSTLSESSSIKYDLGKPQKKFFF